MLKVENLQKYYNKGRRNEINVINNTSIEFPKTGLVAILGNSGSGKTTLLNSLCGIDSVDDGTIYIENHKITHYSSNKFDNLRNRYFGYIFQNYNLLGDLTVYENIALSLKMLGLKKDSDINTRVIRALSIVGMEKYKNRYAKNLSGGEQQRVAIARALVKDVKFILADEPTGNLDTKNTYIIMDILENIAKNRLVIMVTHEKDLAYKYADRIIEISDGKVIKDLNNAKNSQVDFYDANTIYLQDLEQKKLYNNNGVIITEYLENVENHQDLDLDIKLVVRDNRIFIKTSSDTYHIRVVDDQSLINFVDRKKPTLKEYKANVGTVIPINDTDLSNKFSISLLKYYLEGFNKTFRLKWIKKAFLFSFLFASFILTLSIGLYRNSIFVEDEKFLNGNKDLIKVHTDGYDFNKVIDVFENISTRDEVYYWSYNNFANKITISAEKFYQTNGNNEFYNDGLFSESFPLTSDYAVLDYELVKKTNSLIQNLREDEVVLERSIVKYLLKQKQFAIRNIDTSLYYRTEQNIINQIITINNNHYKIVDIVDNNNFAIYLSKEKIENIILDPLNIALYKDVLVNNNAPAPEKGEILVRSGTDYAFNYLNGDNEYWLSDNKLFKIVGTFSTSDENKNFVVNSDDYIYWQLDHYYKTENEIKNINFFSNNLNKTYKYLEELEYNITSVYHEQKNSYLLTWRPVTNILFILAIIAFIAPSIMLFFLMRSNIISRIKEVGIYRALGMKKSNIYKLHIGEVLSISTLFSLPGYLIALIYMYSSRNSVIPIFQFDIFVIIISLVVILGLNILVGVLPVLRLMRKTPQSILTKYDI